MESIPSIFLSLFDVGDQFIRPEDEGSGKLPIGNDQRLTQIILQLLRRLPWDSRFEALRQAITQGRAVFISAKIVMELGKLSDKQAGEERPKAEALIRHERSGRPGRVGACQSAGRGPGRFPPHLPQTAAHLIHCGKTWPGMPNP